MAADWPGGCKTSDTKPTSSTHEELSGVVCVINTYSDCNVSRQFTSSSSHKSMKYSNLSNNSVTATMKHLLLMAFAILTIGCNERESAENIKKASTARQDMTSFSSALEMYKNIGGNYPSNSQGLEALAKRPRSSPRPRDWVQAMDGEEFLFDPWDTKYKYEYSGSYDSSRPEIISAGPDKQFGSEDDMSSQKDSQN